MARHHQSPIRAHRDAESHTVVKYLKSADIESRKEYSVLEVADMMGVSRQTITRAFGHRPGVHVLPGRGKQGIIRIPGHVLAQWLRELTE